MKNYFKAKFLTKVAKYRALRRCQRAQKSLAHGQFEDAFLMLEEASKMAPNMISPKVLVTLAYYLSKSDREVLTHYEALSAELDNWPNLEGAELLNIDARNYLKCYLAELALYSIMRLYGGESGNSGPDIIADYANFDLKKVPSYITRRFRLAFSPSDCHEIKGTD